MNNAQKIYKTNFKPDIKKMAHSVIFLYAELFGGAFLLFTIN